MYWLHRRMGHHMVGPWFNTQPTTEGGSGGGSARKTGKASKQDDDDDDDAGDDSASLVASLTSRYGDAQKALGVLAGENARLRKFKREARANPETLLPEGSYVVPKSDYDELAAFRALGKKPDQLKTEIENGIKLQGELAQKKAEELYTSVAGVLKWQPKVLTDFVKVKELHLELRDETVDGKTVQVPYVRKAANANDPLEKLDAYVEKNHSEYLVALKQDTRDTPTTFPKQGTTSSDTTKPSSVLDKALERNRKAAEAGNAIRPAKKN